MLKFLRRIFGTGRAAAAGPEADAMPVAPVKKVEPHAEKRGGGMEVAPIALRAILEKLPPDLAPIVNQLPDSEVKIVLPVNTIMKQLATGSVKMSLASLFRQAPPNTFRKIDFEDKRLVDVPLGEVFKTVNPSCLRRRLDQRQYDLPEDAAGLFGNDARTRNVGGPGAAPAARKADAPSIPQAAAPEPPTHVAPGAPPVEPVENIESPRILQMPGIPSADTSAPAIEMTGAFESNLRISRSPKTEGVAVLHRTDGCGELTLSFVELAAAWPEGVRSELSILPGDTQVVVPASAVGPGLQKGRIAFPWAQVRSWLRPALTSPVGVAENTELLFPLRIVAPAFVAATGAGSRREAAGADEAIPDAFSSATKKTAPDMQQPAPPTPEVAEVADSTAPVADLKPDGGGKGSTEEADAALATLPVSGPDPESVCDVGSICDGKAQYPAAVANVLSTAIATPAAAEPESCALPGGTSTFCELVQQPAKVAWTPAELVAHTCALPGVVGAVIAIGEGLVVAQQLPEGLSAETFAAFMPQFFGRLETYSQEMKLGEVNEITIQASNAPCHLVRSGKVFFATVGCSGVTFPAGLRLIAEKLPGDIHQ